MGKTATIAEIKQLKGGCSEVRFKGGKVSKVVKKTKLLEDWKVGMEVPLRNGKPSF